MTEIITYNAEVAKEIGEPECNYHAPNPDAKMKPKKFWCVTGKVKGTDGKWTKVSGTFDKEDMALAAALGAKRAGFTVEVFVSGVEWAGYEPTSKGAKEMWGKIEG